MECVVEATRHLAAQARCLVDQPQQPPAVSGTPPPPAAQHLWNRSCVIDSCVFFAVSPTHVRLVRTDNARVQNADSELQDIHLQARGEDTEGAAFSLLAHPTQRVLAVVQAASCVVVDVSTWLDFPNLGAEQRVPAECLVTHKTSGVSLLHCAWHPLSPSHLGALWSDNTLSLHDITTHPPKQERVFRLPSTPRVTSFAFGPPSAGWASATAFLVSRDLAVHPLCPVLPSGALLSPSLLSSLVGTAPSDAATGSLLQHIQLRGRVLQDGTRVVPALGEALASFSPVLQPSLGANVPAPMALSSQPALATVHVLGGGEQGEEGQHHQPSKSSGVIAVAVGSNGGVCDLRLVVGPIVPWWGSGEGDGPKPCASLALPLAPEPSPAPPSLASGTLFLPVSRSACVVCSRAGAWVLSLPLLDALDSGAGAVSSLPPPSLAPVHTLPRHSGAGARGVVGVGLLRTVLSGGVVFVVDSRLEAPAPVLCAYQLFAPKPPALPSQRNAQGKGGGSEGAGEDEWPRWFDGNPPGANKGLDRLRELRKQVPAGDSKGLDGTRAWDLAQQAQRHAGEAANALEASLHTLQNHMVFLEERDQEHVRMAEHCAQRLEGVEDTAAVIAARVARMHQRDAVLRRQAEAVFHLAESALPPEASSRERRFDAEVRDAAERLSGLQAQQGQLSAKLVALARDVGPQSEAPKARAVGDQKAIAAFLEEQQAVTDHLVAQLHELQGKLLRR